MKHTDQKMASAAGDKKVRKYPANELKKPVKKFSDTFRAADVLKQKFFA